MAQENVMFVPLKQQANIMKIIELFWSEKIFDILESDCYPSTVMSTIKQCL